MEAQCKLQCSVSRLRLYDGRGIYVCGTSSDKPDVPPETIDKWKALADHAATSLTQPHALITRLVDDVLYVLVHNSTADKTFDNNDNFPLGLGVYCETTMSRNTVNLVPNALADTDWDTNPSIDFSLISYIGMPTRWPDGEIFGTICALGDKPLERGESLMGTIALFKSMVETDLQLLYEREQNKKQMSLHDKSICEVHHRVKNHLNILCSLVQLESPGTDMTPEAFLAWQEKINKQIQAVSELHTILAYKDGGPVDLSQYLKKIIDAWITSTLDRDVSVADDLEPVLMNEKNIIYFGILLNELITNSFNHAFTAVPTPAISLTLKNEGESFRLIYRDNGPGLSGGFPSATANSLGMTLISELTASLNGTISYANDSGAKFEFSFPVGMG